MTDKQKAIIKYYVDKQEEEHHPSIREVAEHVPCTPAYVMQTLQKFNAARVIDLEKRKVNVKVEVTSPVEKFFVKVLDESALG